MRRDPTARANGYTAKSYLTILQDGLLPIHKPDMIYQQDGAPTHTAKVSEKWLKDHGIKFIEDWPAYSPDWNSIEHIWPLLKETIYQLYPDIELWRGGEKEIQERMEDALVHAWSQIRDVVASNCVSSMPDRIQAVITAGGWYTRY